MITLPEASSKKILGEKQLIIKNDFMVTKKLLRRRRV
jgi:hypothetical protein